MHQSRLADDSLRTWTPTLGAPEGVLIEVPAAVRVELKGTRDRVLLPVILAMEAFILGATVLGGGAAVYTGLTSVSKPGEAPRVAIVLLGIGIWALAPLSYLSLMSHLRTFRAKDPFVILGPEGMTFHNQSVFVDPQPVPGSVIRNIAIGPGVTGRFTKASPWSRTRPVVLSPYAQVPNAVIEFTEPILLDRAYVAFTLYKVWVGQPPNCREPVNEVWFALEDPQGAFQVLEQWGPTSWEEVA